MLAATVAPCGVSANASSLEARRNPVRYGGGGFDTDSCADSCAWLKACVRDGACALVALCSSLGVLMSGLKVNRLGVRLLGRVGDASGELSFDLSLSLSLLRGTTYTTTYTTTYATAHAHANTLPTTYSPLRQHTYNSSGLTTSTILYRGTYLVTVLKRPHKEEMWAQAVKHRGIKVLYSADDTTRYVGIIQLACTMPIRVGSHGDPYTAYKPQSERKWGFAVFFDPGFEICFAPSTWNVACWGTKHISNHGFWRYFNRGAM